MMTFIRLARDREKHRMITPFPGDDALVSNSMLRVFQAHDFCLTARPSIFDRSTRGGGVHLYPVESRSERMGRSRTRARHLSQAVDSSVQSSTEHRCIAGCSFSTSGSRATCCSAPNYRSPPRESLGFAGQRHLMRVSDTKSPCAPGTLRRPRLASIRRSGTRNHRSTPARLALRGTRLGLPAPSDESITTARGAKAHSIDSGNQPLASDDEESRTRIQIGSAVFSRSCCAVNHYDHFTFVVACSGWCHSRDVAPRALGSTDEVI
jgi:hypothetical protein